MPVISDIPCQPMEVKPNPHRYILSLVPFSKIILLFSVVVIYRFDG